MKYEKQNKIHNKSNNGLEEFQNECVNEIAKVNKIKFMYVFCVIFILDFVEYIFLRLYIGLLTFKLNR